MPRGGSDLVVIYWRDIPAQVNAQVGRDRHQVLLSAKFQRAIDRAKRKAKIDTAHEDVAQWRRESRPLSGDPRAEAEAEATRIEQRYTREHLGLLAFAGGFEADIVASPVDIHELAALEELEDDENENENDENENDEDDENENENDGQETDP
jgi:hypothetical protein